MIYIYDVLLNFNECLIEFFEWEEDDDIKYIRKIPVFNVSSKTIRDFVLYKVKLEKELENLIKDKALFYDENSSGCQNVALIADGKMALGINVSDGEIVGISRLLLDEELEVLKLVGRIPETIVSYEIIGKRKEKRNKCLTRNELKIIKSLKEEFTQLYNENKVEKLNYYYYEYFNERSNDKELVYNALIDSVEHNFNEKHILLYNIIKLSYRNNINI